MFFICILVEDTITGKMYNQIPMQRNTEIFTDYACILGIFLNYSS